MCCVSDNPLAGMKTYPFQEGLKQQYELYTPEDFQVWQILYDRQMQSLPQVADESFLSGIEKIGFNRLEIPDFVKVNERLMRLTGWKIIEVPGIIESKLFFRMLANKQFPATTWLRSMSELDYLSEPDMFHDVFGHVPLLSNPMFCGFYQQLGEIGSQHLSNEPAIEMLGRIYWFTVEFGLIRQNDTTKIYGSGILSSSGETAFSLSEVPQHIPFDAALVMNTPYRNDVIQDKYFVINSFDQLMESTNIIRDVLRTV